jgi:[protein-PII] uridylyltransferase
MAVGPEVLSTWKMMLFEELYSKARAILDKGGVAPVSVSEQAAATAARFEARVAGRYGVETVRRFLDGVDHPQYLLSYSLEALTRHLAVYCRRESEPAVELFQNQAEGYTEVVISTRDRPGLFADFAGITAAHRMNILSAGLNTRSDGWVIDVLRVTEALGGLVTSEEKWSAWRRDLLAVLRGETNTKALLEGRARRGGQAFPRSAPAREPKISVDNHSSSRFTVVDVSTRDRLGLLYDIASTLAALGLNIRLAKIATTLEKAVDAFYVEKLGGGKIHDPHELARIRSQLLEAVGAGDYR